MKPPVLGDAPLRDLPVAARETGRSGLASVAALIREIYRHGYEAGYRAGVDAAQVIRADPDGRPL